MKKIVDDGRLIYKVCSLYYKDDMRQQDISEYLGISRATVSRMLQKGKEEGIVRIEVINPVQFSYGEIEKALERKYGLKEVVVVESSVLDTKDESISRLYEEAARFLALFFKEGQKIGVSMGHTVHNIAKTNVNLKKGNDYLFVPMLGGISPSSTGVADIQSNSVAQEFARKFGGQYTQFLSPAVFSEHKIMDYFMKEESVNFILEDLQKLDTVVMGIGIPQRMESTIVKAGYISESQLQEFANYGLVGDVALQFFDEKGDTEKFCEFNDRVAGIKPDMIRSVPNRIGVAGGENKAEAIKGAIRGGFVNILITNVDAANRLL